MLNQWLKVSSKIKKEKLHKMSGTLEAITQQNLVLMLMLPLIIQFYLT
jgi:hypothetical protein